MSSILGCFRTTTAIVAGLTLSICNWTTGAAATSGEISGELLMTPTVTLDAGPANFAIDLNSNETDYLDSELPEQVTEPIVVAHVSSDPSHGPDLATLGLQLVSEATIDEGGTILVRIRQEQADRVHQFISYPIKFSVTQSGSFLEFPAEKVEFENIIGGNNLSGFLRIPPVTINPYFSVQTAITRIRSQAEIPTIDDEIDEDNGTITVKLEESKYCAQYSMQDPDECIQEADYYNIQPANHQYPNSVTVTVRDDDEQTSTLNISDVSRGSNAREFTFEVTLSPVSGKRVTVDYASRDVTTTSEPPGTLVNAYDAEDKSWFRKAVANKDLFTVSGTLTFEPGEVTKTIAVKVFENPDQSEGDETFEVILSNPSNATISDDTATGTIKVTDDPVVNIVAAYTQANGNNPLYSIVADSAQSADLEVTYQYNYYLGSNIFEYIPSKRLTATIPMGQNSVALPILPVTSTTGGTLRIAIVDVNANYVLGSSSFHTPPSHRLSIADSIPRHENDNVLEFVVTLTPATNQQVSVDFETVHVSTDSSDYYPVSETLTFSPGETSKTIEILLKQDLDDSEGDETFQVLLSNAENASIVNERATGTILDRNVPVVTIGSKSILDDDADAIFYILLDQPSDSPIDVTYHYNYKLETEVTKADDICLVVYVDPDGMTVTQPIRYVCLDRNAYEVSTDGYHQNDSDTDSFYKFRFSPWKNLTATVPAGVTEFALPPLPVEHVDGGLHLHSDGMTTTDTRTVGNLVVLLIDSGVDYVVGTPYIQEIPPVSTAIKPSVSIEPIVSSVTKTDSAMFRVSAVPAPAASTQVTVHITEEGNYLPSSRLTGCRMEDDVEVGCHIVETVTLTADSPSATISIDLDDSSTDTTDGIILATIQDGRGYQSGGYTQSATARVTATVSQPELRISNAAGHENEHVLRFSVSLFPQSSNSVTVDYRTSDGTAIATSDSSTADYYSTSGQLTFQPGDTLKEIEVSLQDDSNDNEGDEQFEVVLSNAANAIFSVSRATGTIMDGDVPEVTLKTEFLPTGQTDAYYYVAVDEVHRFDLEVSYEYNYRSDADVFEFTNWRSGRITIPGGQSYARLPLFPVQMNSKNLALRLVDNVTDYVLGSPYYQDAPPAATASSPHISIERVGPSVVSEAPPASDTIQSGPGSGPVGQQVTFRVTADPAPSASTNVVVHITQSGDVIDADTHTFSNNRIEETVTLTSTTSSKDIVITIDDDDVVELSGKVIATIQPGTNYQVGEFTNSAFVTIEEDRTGNNAPSLMLRMTNSGSTVTEGGSKTTIVYTLRPSRAVEGEAVVVTIAASENSVAKLNEDFTLSATSLTFSDANPQTITMTVIDDLFDEEDELIEVKLTATNAILAGTGGSIGTGGTATITGVIKDNDPLPTLSISDANRGENGISAYFDVTLSSVSGREVIVGLKTQDGTAIAEGASIGDYDSVAVTIAFAPGETTSSVPVPINSDNENEGMETFSVILENPVNATIVDGTAIGTISDDDDPTVTLETEFLPDDATNVNYFVVLDVIQTRNLMVHYEYNYKDATGYENAIWTRKSVLVNSGLKFKMLEPIAKEVGDGDVEVKLINVGRDYLLGDPSVQGLPEESTSTDPLLSIEVVDIMEVNGFKKIPETKKDNDDPNTVMFRITAMPMPSGSIEGEVHITQRGNFISTTAHTFTNEQIEQNFSLTNAIFEFPISLHDDDIAEPEGEITATIQPGTGYKLGEYTKAATVTITDDDRFIDVDKTSIELTEGTSGATSATINFTLSTPSDGTVTLTQMLMSDDFYSNDLTLTPNNLVFDKSIYTFPSGASSGSIAVTVVNDSLDEKDIETIKLTLTAHNAIFAEGNSTVVDVAITDDDPEPQLSIADSVAFEGESISFTVTLTPASGRVVEVNYNSVNGTANASTDQMTGDFTIASGTLVFEVGETTKTIMFDLHDDTRSEGDETFEMVLTNPKNAQIQDDRATGTIKELPVVTLQTEFFVEGDQSVDFYFVVDRALTEDLAINYEFNYEGPIGKFSNPNWTKIKNPIIIPQGQTYRILRLTKAQAILEVMPPNTLMRSIVFRLVDGQKYKLGNPHRQGLPPRATSKEPHVTIGPQTVIVDGVVHEIYQVSETRTSPTVPRSVIFEVRSNPPPNSPKTVTVNFTQVGDYIDQTVHPLINNIGTMTVVLTPSEPEKSISITVEDDAVIERIGSITATIQPSDNQQFNVGTFTNSATTYVSDDDGLEIISVFALNDPIEEGEIATFEISSTNRRSRKEIDIIVTQSDDYIFGPVPRTVTLANGTSILEIQTTNQPNRTDPGRISVSIQPNATEYDTGPNIVASVTVNPNIVGDDGNRYSIASAVVETILGATTANVAPLQSPSKTTPVKISIVAKTPTIEEGQVAKFHLTASRPAETGVSVNVRLSETGDFITGPSVVTAYFSPGEMEIELLVATTDDSIAEDDGEISALIIEGHDYLVGNPKDAAITVSDENDRKARQNQLAAANGLVLTEMIGFVSAGTINAPTQRISTAFNQDNPHPVKLGGQSNLKEMLKIGGESLNVGSGVWRQILGDSAFTVGLYPEEGFANSTTIWGVGDLKRNSNASFANGNTLDLEVFSGQFGVDSTLSENIVAGLSTSVTQTNASLTTPVEKLEYEGQLTGLHPYLGFETPDRQNRIHVVGGYGRSEFELDQENYGTEKFEGSFYNIGLGGSGRLYSGDSQFFGGNQELKINGNSWIASQFVKSSGYAIKGFRMSAHHFNLGGTATQEVMVGNGSTITPSVVMGLRGDRKMNSEFIGTELGTGISYGNPIGIEVSGNATVLLSQFVRFRDLGLTGSATIDPNNDQVGLIFDVKTNWKFGGTSGTDSLWDDMLINSGNQSGVLTDGSGVDSELGYGFKILDDTGLLTPYSGFAHTSRYGNKIRIGGNYEAGSTIELKLEGTRVLPLDREIENELMLKGGLKW